jgi:hypothetical protein
MADKIVKLNSKQGGPFNARQNLIDFTIPAGMAVDMSKSYVNLQCRCETRQSFDGVFDFKLVYTVGGTAHELTAPNTAIVRNCQLSSANKGMLEDIRRSDVLRTNLHYLKKTTEDSDGMLYKQLLPHRTRTNHLQSIWRDLKGEGLLPSRQLTAPIQIPMSDLFNLGAATVDTSFTGDIRVHLEISPERFEPRQLYNGPLSDDFGSPFMKDMQDISGITTDISVLTSAIKYLDLSDSPFWTLMPVTVKFTRTDTEQDPPTVEDFTYNTLIQSIEYVRVDEDPEEVGRLKITLQDAFPTATPSATQTFSDILIHGSSALEYDGLEFSIDYAEIVLQESDPVKMDGLVYSTYTSQETNGYGVQQFAEQFIVEPSCYNFMALALNGNDLLTEKEDIKEYRIRSDNLDTTDRNVVVGTPLYHDRLSMYQINNGEALKSLVLHSPSASASSNSARYSDVPVTPYMVSPLPVTPSTKIVDLNVVATEGGVDKVIVFKSVIKQL